MLNKSSNIRIIGSYLPDRSFSMIRYADLIYRAANKDSDLFVDYVQPKVYLGNFKLQSKVSKYLKYIDKYLINSLEFNLLKQTDLVHITDQSNSVYMPFLKANKIIVTCHDIIPILCMLNKLEGYKPGKFACNLYQNIWNNLEKADHIICDSFSTRKDVIEILGINPVKTSVSYFCMPPNMTKINSENAKLELKEIGILTHDKFVLYVGGPEFYKNSESIPVIFEKANLKGKFKLVTLGNLSPKFYFNLEKYKLTNLHHPLNNISDRTLRCLYQKAEVLLYPYTYAGFGWPIIEAMANKTPVLTSNIASMPEVAGKAALIEDPLDISSMARKLNQILFDKDLQLKLIQLGLKNVKRFKFFEWEKRTIDLYKSFTNL